MVYIILNISGNTIFIPLFLKSKSKYVYKKFSIYLLKRISDYIDWLNFSWINLLMALLKGINYTGDATVLLIMLINY